MTASATHQPADSDGDPQAATSPQPETSTPDPGPQAATPPPGDTAPRQPADSPADGGGCCGRPAMIAVSGLAGHPGNVRGDLELTRSFCASVAEAGVRIPLLVTPSGDGYRVVEGHRRLAAAVKAGADRCALHRGPRPGPRRRRAVPRYGDR
jgi:hypothetical protein